MYRTTDRLITWAAVLALAFLVGVKADRAFTAQAAPIEQKNAVFGEISPKMVEIVPDTTRCEPNIYATIWANANDVEKALFVQILALEAQGEPYEGIMAAAEVMLNRVASDEWPDTIYGVLSQKGQFAAWRYRNDPYNTPTLTEYHAVDDVVAAGPSVLPEDYVYFATRKVNGRDFIRIGHHYFSR